jgi:hypothetical protein
LSLPVLHILNPLGDALLRQRQHHEWTGRRPHDAAVRTAQFEVADNGLDGRAATFV